MRMFSIDNAYKLHLPSYLPRVMMIYVYGTGCPLFHHLVLQLLDPEFIDPQFTIFYFYPYIVTLIITVYNYCKFIQPLIRSSRFQGEIRLPFTNFLNWRLNEIMESTYPLWQLVKHCCNIRNTNFLNFSVCIHYRAPRISLLRLLGITPNALLRNSLRAC